MIRALIVDDSAAMRVALTVALGNDPEISVVGTAPDAYVAREMIAELRPDVITLDLEMPKIDGLTFLRLLMRYHPIPTIIISALSQGAKQLSLEALSAGAVDVVVKPNGRAELAAFGPVLKEKVRAAAGVNPVRCVVSGPPPSPSPVSPLSVVHVADRLIAIGASTGGTVAIERVLSGLPAASPPIVVVQHMPAGFTKSFAERLNRSCQVEVREAVDDEELRPGVALIAPGSHHLRVKARGGRLFAEKSDAPPVNRHRPSVDVLFDSIAQLSGGPSVVAALLTGMGEDGANGLLALRRRGARTIAEDESTCVVYGMPRAAVERGAAVETVRLPEIAGRLLAE